MFSILNVAWAQAEAVEVEKTVAENGIWHLITNADPVVKLALFILIGFSVISWAIIFYKFKQVKRAQADSQNFWSAFAQTKSLKELIEHKKTTSGPLFEIFKVASEWSARLQKGGKTGKSSREMVLQKLAQAREEEIYKLEQYTPFLATTASTAPFIGLFGTVWGILTAFWAIGKAGSSSLATVGPYISEALVATAIGLAAAIPAVVAYNHFVHRTKVLIKMMDLFVDDLSLRIEEDTV